MFYIIAQKVVSSNPKSDKHAEIINHQKKSQYKYEIHSFSFHHSVSDLSCVEDRQMDLFAALQYSNAVW